MRWCAGALVRLCACALVALVALVRLCGCAVVRLCGCAVVAIVLLWLLCFGTIVHCWPLCCCHHASCRVVVSCAQPKAKGGKPTPAAKGGAAPPPARQTFPFIREDASTGVWTGVGNYNLKALDVSGNQLGTHGVIAVLQGLVPSRQALAAELPRSVSPPTAAKGKAAAAAPPVEAKATPDAALKAGNLVLPVTLHPFKLFAAQNRADTAAIEALLPEYVPDAPGEHALSLL